METNFAELMNVSNIAQYFMKYAISTILLQMMRNGTVFQTEDPVGLREEIISELVSRLEADG